MLLLHLKRRIYEAHLRCMKHGCAVWSGTSTFAKATADKACHEAKPFQASCFFCLGIKAKKMVDHFRLIQKILSSSNGCELIENGHRFVNLRKHLCFQRFWKQRKFFYSTERTFSPKQTQNAPKNSCTSDFFPKGIQRSVVRASSYQTILVCPPWMYHLIFS